VSGVYQRKDHFYNLAKNEGYRSRAAYKLMELDKKFNIIPLGGRILDAGCFPGGWLQVAAHKAGSKGKVVGVDLDPIEPIRHSEKHAPIEFILGDITDAGIRDKARDALAGHADAVISDISPKLSGIRFRDVANSIDLVSQTFEFAKELLCNKGTFVAKLFPGQESEDFIKGLRSQFDKIGRSHLSSSRKTSSEFYLVATGFHNLERKD